VHQRQYERVRTGTNVRVLWIHGLLFLTQFFTGSWAFPGRSGPVRTQVGPGTNGYERHLVEYIFLGLRASAPVRTGTNGYERAGAWDSWPFVSDTVFYGLPGISWTVRAGTNAGRARYKQV